MIYKVYSKGLISGIVEDKLIALSASQTNAYEEIAFMPDPRNDDGWIGYYEYRKKGSRLEYHFESDYDPREIFIGPANIAIEKYECFDVDGFLVDSDIIDAFLMADDSVIIGEDDFRYESFHRFEEQETFQRVVKMYTIPHVRFTEEEEEELG